MRATRAMSRVTLSVAFWTLSAGISSPISRLQVASVVSVMDKVQYEVGERLI
jgi:hypothetical protein